MTLDVQAGGPPWDRPSDEDEFAPPVEAHDLHWAFRSPEAESRAAAEQPAGPEEGRHWAFRQPDSATDTFDRGWTPEDGARLVTASPRQLGAVPRDPAQPGIFDRYDAFAPVADEPWWDPAPPAEGSLPVTDGPVVAAPMAPIEPPPAAAAPAADSGSGESGSVFGDLFAGVPSATPRPVPDPREWPPIPGALLPLVPQSLGDMTGAEPDGRRFTWPPPQPRVAPPPTPDHPDEAGRPDEPPASTAGQESLWEIDDRTTAESRQTPPAASSLDEFGVADGYESPVPSESQLHLVPPAAAHPASANRTLFTVVLIVAIGLALILLFSRFVAPLLG